MLSDESQSRIDAELDYVEGASSLLELVENSELVLVAEPLPEPEAVLRPDHEGAGVAIMGRRFVVTEVLKGPARVGDVTTVIRTNVNQASHQPEPTFDFPLYLLGLNSTSGSYGISAWYCIGGKEGRVALDRDASDTLMVVSEDVVDALEEQEQLIGEAKDRLLDRVMEVVSP